MPDPNPMLMGNTRPFSLQHIRRTRGGSDPLWVALMAELLYDKYTVVREEFQGTLDSALWTTAVSGGGGPTAFAYSAARGGQIQGATGITDNDATAIHMTRTHFDPDDNPFLFIQWKANAVTGFSFEIGLSDPKTDEALPGVTDVDTPTVGNGVTDIVCVHMDTDQDLATAELIGDGTTGAATASAGPTLTTAAYTPTAGAWQAMLIGVRANAGYAVINDGNGFVGRFSVANGPDSGVLVRPYAFFRTRNTVTKTIDIRKIIVGCEMNG